MKNDAIRHTGKALSEPIQYQASQPHRILVEEERPRNLQRNPQLQHGAPLLKPHTISEYLGTEKRVLCAVLALLTLQLSLPSIINAQAVIQPPSGLRIVSTDSSARPNAVVVSAHSATRPNAVAVSIHGKCECSEDGVTFTNLERGHILEQAATIRTGEDGWIDLFFWRTGATVRLQVGTEIKLEKMVINVRDGRPAMHILLDLRTGRLFTVVRHRVAGSTLEIRNAAGRSVMEGNRVGRYIIAADGTHVSDKVSEVPLKLIGENGITFIAAGEQFSKQDGKTLSVPSAPFVRDLAQLDELQAVAEKPFPKEPFPKP